MDYQGEYTLLGLIVEGASKAEDILYGVNIFIQEFGKILKGTEESEIDAIKLNIVSQLKQTQGSLYTQASLDFLLIFDSKPLDYSTTMIKEVEKVNKKMIVDYY